MISTDSAKQNGYFSDARTILILYRPIETRKAPIMAASKTPGIVLRGFV
jgi:hypothetical protein